MRRLDPTRVYKPLDFGNGRLAGSVAPDGRLLSLSIYHPVYGYVVLSATGIFPDARRHDQPAVRGYRGGLADRLAPAFGLHFPEAVGDVALLADAVPTIRLAVGDVEVECQTWAPRDSKDGPAAACQVWRAHNPTDQPVTLDFEWRGPLALHRASYSQLTPRGHVETPASTLELTYERGQLRVAAPDLGAVALIRGLPVQDAWSRSGEGRLEVTALGRLSLGSGETQELRVLYALASTDEEAEAALAAAESAATESHLSEQVERYRRRWAALDTMIPEAVRPLAHRAQMYVLDCCALRVGEGICLLTDHQILPLSWTRDAYFLVQGVTPGGASKDLVRRHLKWLFETAERPEGYWGRAFLANGQPMDDVFQLDQQCYPLLELAEYLAVSSDDAEVEGLLASSPDVLRTILARRAPDVELYATEETPADDPMPFPYHFSSQVLFWHTLRRLADIQARRPFTDVDLVAMADAVRAATLRHFVVEHGGADLFAYAVDLQGAHRLYHDANDLPTVLAPVWGFCAVDDPRWRATLEFAFSAANGEGYYPGQYGGLGSVHTPAPWPLGDVQELMYARLIGDAARSDAVLARLVATACWDGALPEARDAESGAVRSRHWFGWPAAALVAALAAENWRRTN